MQVTTFVTDDAESSGSSPTPKDDEQVGAVLLLTRVLRGADLVAGGINTNGVSAEPFALCRLRNRHAFSSAHWSRSTVWVHIV